MKTIPLKTASILLSLIIAASLCAPGFAATLNSREAKALFALMNTEREDAGQATFTWDADLAEAAEIRAKEIAYKYTQDHTRPDGSSFFSVSTKAWGENTAYGYDDSDACMTAFNNSRGHRANVLDKRFTIAATACAVDDDGVMYWVQIFGTGKSNASWAGVSSYTLDPFSSAKPTQVTATNTVSITNKDGAVNASAIADVFARSRSGKIRLTDAVSISPEALNAIADASAKRAYLQVNTLSADGTVQGGITLEPAKLTARKTPIRLGIYVDRASVSAVKKAAEESYSNAMAYIRMAHRGSLTTRTLVNARVDLSGVGSKILMLYVYSSDTGEFRLIENAEPSYKDGMLSFYTATAGDIVVTNRALA